MTDTDPSPSEPLGELYASLVAMSYLMSRSRTHARLSMQAGVAIDRAGLALLRELVASGEPMRLGELAEALHVKAPHVTRQVVLLEESGLLSTTREPGDQRVRRVTVTDEGREAVARTEDAGRRRLAEAVEGFTPEQVRTAAAVVRRVVDTLGRD